MEHSDEQHEPYWIPFTPPPQTWADRARAAARRYGFPVAAGLSVLLVAVALWIGGVDVTPERSSPADRSDALAAPERNPAPLSTDDHSYAGTAMLSVSSEPRGAQVTLGGEALGQTPLREVVVPAGTHLVSIRKEGYPVLDSILMLPRDGASDVHVAFAKDAQGRPSVTASTSAERASSARKAFQEAARRGDDLFVQDRHAEALRAYEEALQHRPGDANIQERIQKTKRAMSGASAAQGVSAQQQPRRSREELAARARKRYDDHRRAGDRSFDKRRYQEAVESYEAALRFREDDAYVQERLAEARRRARVVGW